MADHRKRYLRSQCQRLVENDVRLTDLQLDLITDNDLQRRVAPALLENTVVRRICLYHAQLTENGVTLLISTLAAMHKSNKTPLDDGVGGSLRELSIYKHEPSSIFPHYIMPAFLVTNQLSFLSCLEIHHDTISEEMNDIFDSMEFKGDTGNNNDENEKKGSSLSRLVLFDCKINVSQIKNGWIGKFLTQILSSNLIYLDLGCNTLIGDTGAKELAKMLLPFDVDANFRNGSSSRAACCLRTLRLESCSIGDNGVLALMRALECNGTLETLHLDGNHEITYRGATAIGESLRNLKGLKHLDLFVNCSKEPRFLTTLIKGLQYNQVLLTLDHCYCSCEYRTTIDKTSHASTNGDCRHETELQYYLGNFHQNVFRQIKNQDLPLKVWPLLLERVSVLSQCNAGVLFYYLKNKPSLFEL